MSKKQTITILLPHAPTHPVGGFKVIYEYANRLVKDNFDVKIVYGIAGVPVYNLFGRCAYKFLRFFRYLKYRFFVDWKPIWFDLDSRIEHILRYDFLKLPKSDFYIATAWSTAKWVDRVKNVETKNKIYLIQSFEDWSTSVKKVEQTWKLPLTRVVIAPWLVEKGKEIGVDTILVENGFDQDYFKLSNSIEKRNAYSVSMLYHTSPLKGCADGFKAIEIVKKKFPNLSVSIFGTVERPQNLPKWIEYHQKPNKELHNKIYNNSAVYIAPSHIEGFALTPAEAMLCGAVVCATNIGGYTVVCRDQKTALLSPVADYQAMADNIIKVLEDDRLRVQIAHNALENIKNYNWENAYAKFKKLFK